MGEMETEAAISEVCDRQTQKHPLQEVAATRLDSLKAGAEKLKFGSLEFGVGVRADFAVEIDFFVLRCGPFHGWLLESRNVDTKEDYHGFRLKGKDVVGALPLQTQLWRLGIRGVEKVQTKTRVH
jgi:hypothetical protein